MVLKRKAMEAQERSFKGMSLPKNDTLSTRAEQAVTDYVGLYVVPDSLEEISSGKTTQPTPSA